MLNLVKIWHGFFRVRQSWENFSIRINLKGWERWSTRSWESFRAGFPWWEDKGNMDCGEDGSEGFSWKRDAKDFAFVGDRDEAGAMGWKWAFEGWGSDVGSFEIAGGDVEGGGPSITCRNDNTSPWENGQKEIFDRQSYHAVTLIFPWTLHDILVICCFLQKKGKTFYWWETWKGYEIATTVS